MGEWEDACKMIHGAKKGKRAAAGRGRDGGSKVGLAPAIMWPAYGSTRSVHAMLHETREQDVQSDKRDMGEVRSSTTICSLITGKE